VSQSRPTVLVLASTFPRWAGDTEPRFVESLSYELARKFDVIVLAPHSRGAARNETLRRGENELEVHRFRYCFERFETLAYEGGMLWRARQNPFRLLLLPLFLISQFTMVLRLCSRRDVDAIHAHWIVPQGFGAAMLRVIHRRCPPILITSHGGDLYALRGRLLERLKRWILSKADAITVVSTAMLDYCKENEFAPGKITVRSMGVDLQNTFTPGDEDVSREGLVFVGRLVEKKGVAYLVEAISLLAEKHRDVRLTVVGDGPLRESLVELAMQLGVNDRIRFAGSVHNEELPDLLRGSAIAVMPSVVAASGDQEGLGLVAVEAMGCGCAVVASDLPAVRDTVIDGETGLMAKPADATDLARKIARLLEDDELRCQLAESGRRHALNKFTWPAVGDSYAEIITGMLDDQR
jgi:phosphatidylinositol alpha-1,6-mannosyltransferase